jgi:hypothetical protein
MQRELGMASEAARVQGNQEEGERRHP